MWIISQIKTQQAKYLDLHDKIIIIVWSTGLASDDSYLAARGSSATTWGREGDSVAMNTTYPWGYKYKVWHYIT